MTKETRHAASGMVLGQSISRENKRKSRVARRGEAVFWPGKPIDYGVRVARIKCVVHRRFERFVVSRHRSVLQTFRNMQPPKTVFVQDERRIARDPSKSAFVSSWAKLGRLVGHKIRDVDAAPFVLALVPPNQFLALAPRFAGRFGARSIIYNAAIGRPGKAPAVAQKIRRFPRKRLVDFVRTDDAGVNPATARGRAVGL